MDYSHLHELILMSLNGGLYANCSTADVAFGFFHVSCIARNRPSIPPMILKHTIS
jgi:hypothetical protein